MTDDRMTPRRQMLVALGMTTGIDPDSQTFDDWDAWRATGALTTDLLDRLTPGSGDGS